MAEREIEIVIKAKDLASGEIEEVIKKITDIGPKSDKHSGLMRLGMFSVGESVEAVTGQFGIMGKAGRQVGNVVEGLVGSMGTFGAVLGGSTILIGGAVMVWRHFAEEKKKAHETLEKSVETLLREESALNKNMVSTQGLREANERLHAVKQRILDMDMAKWIKQEREEIEKLTVKIIEMKDRGYTGLTAPIMNYIFAQQIAKKNEEEAQALIGDRDRKEAELIQKQEERKAQRINQLFVLNEAEKAKYYDYNMIWAQEWEQEERRKQHQLKMDQEIVANKALMMGGVSSIMGMLYDVTGRKMKAFFILQKAAAASEAFFNYQLAAAKAVGQTGIFGMPMQAYFQAMSYIVPPLIMASAFTGPGGGGGAAATGGIPTVSTGGTEGIPSGGEGQAITYTTNISVNAIDGADVQRIVENYVFPAMADADARNVQVQ